MNSFAVFYQLAGPDLLSLSCSPELEDLLMEGPPITLAYICELRGLTKLTLSGYKRNTFPSALQSLKLQELGLICSPGAAQQMLSTGSMTTLRKLYIWEYPDSRPCGVGEFHHALRDTSSPHHTWAQELDQLGQAVLRLPRLVKVSGSCSLFRCALAEELRGWDTWMGKDSQNDPYQAWRKLI